MFSFFKKKKKQELPPPLPPESYEGIESDQLKALEEELGLSNLSLDESQEQPQESSVDQHKEEIQQPPMPEIKEDQEQQGEIPTKVEEGLEEEKQEDTAKQEQQPQQEEQVESSEEEDKKEEKKQEIIEEKELYPQIEEPQIKIPHGDVTLGTLLGEKKPREKLPSHLFVNLERYKKAYPLFKELLTDISLLQDKNQNLAKIRQDIKDLKQEVKETLIQLEMSLLRLMDEIYGR